MRYILIFWALPMSFLWGWYFLSANDISFGTLFLSKDLHHLVFEIYGQILGVDPALIPSMLAKACILDTALIFAILAFRRRKSIRAWWNARQAQATPAAADNLESLSSAP